MEEKKKYQVLAIPTKKVLEYQHIYYKEYTKEKEELVEVPKKRSLYAIRFDEAFSGDYVKRYFGLAGKIQTVHVGEYKHRANNKKKRRQLWFAIIIYKRPEDCEKALDGRWLQSQIVAKYGNGKGKWQLSFKPAEQPTVPEPEMTEEERQQRDKIARMEAEGFTVMQPQGSKRYVSDGATSMKFITKKMIDRMMGKEQKTEPEIENPDFYEPTAAKKKRTASGFYLYETKDAKKAKLTELRRGLDEDMQLIAHKQALANRLFFPPFLVFVPHH